jgi:hypothetical protein
MEEKDVSGLPNVDPNALAALVDPDKGQGDTQPNVGDVDLGTFKTPEDMLKAYREVQGFATRLSNENKNVKEELQSLKEQLELMRYSTPQNQPSQQPHPANWDFDRAFVENAGGAVTAVAAGVAEQVTQRAIRASKIEEVLVEEEAKNPQEFQERFSYAMQLKNKYPSLVNTSAGVRKLFKMADDMRLQDTRAKSEMLIKQIAGEDVDLEKFKQLLKKDNPNQDQNRQNAFMPDIGGSHNLNSTSSGSRNFDSAINDAAAKGDVDTVIKGMFSKILSET